MNSEQNSLRILTGENLFRSGETIYINKAYEEAESHMHSHDFIEIAYIASDFGVNDQYNDTRKQDRQNSENKLE